MDPVLKITLWWVLFGGTHIVGSSAPVRTWATNRFGVPAFKGLYSVVAFATFIPLCVVYAQNKHAGFVIYQPVAFVQHITELLMLLAVIVLVQGAMTLSPITTTAEMTGNYGSGARGIQRVTRHPVGMAFVIFGVAHCLANPFLADWVFFGGFVVYVILSAMHQDARMLATGPPAAQSYVQETSLVPFGAMLGGRQRLHLGEFSVIGLVIAVALTGALRAFHGGLFGGFGG